jgi:hypothetical protein
MGGGGLLSERFDDRSQFDGADIDIMNVRNTNESPMLAKPSPLPQ